MGIMFTVRWLVAALLASCVATSQSDPPTSTDLSPNELIDHEVSGGKLGAENAEMIRSLLTLNGSAMVVSQYAAIGYLYPILPIPPGDISLEGWTVLGANISDIPRYSALRDADAVNHPDMSLIYAALRSPGSNFYPLHDKVWSLTSMFDEIVPYDFFKKLIDAGLRQPRNSTYCLCPNSYPVDRQTPDPAFLGDCEPGRYPGDQKERALWKAKLDLVNDILANETAATILKGVHYTHLNNRNLELPYKPFMKVIGLPLDMADTMFARWQIMRYGFYAKLVNLSRDCSDQAVICGKNAGDPCDTYPPAPKIRDIVGY